MNSLQNFEKIIQKIRNYGIEIRENENLSKYSYYKIGGPARAVLFPRNLDELQKIYSIIESPPQILGAGSNVLIDDLPYLGFVLCTKKMGHQILEWSTDKSEVRVGAGLLISIFLRRAMTEGWGGFEFLTGIPGSMGGAIVMNAGTHLGEISKKATKVIGFDFSTGKSFEKFLNSESFAYRKNLFLNESSIVTEYFLKTDRLDLPEKITEQISQLLKRRKETQPVDFPSCGSVFKNPENTKLRAWQVIEELGLRGYVQGGAQISEKHPNFIINKNNAKAVDVKILIDKIKKEAFSKLGIHMEQEVRYFPKPILNHPILCQKE